MNKAPTVLLIMDGYGLGTEDQGNAIHRAKTPELDRLIALNPHTTLSASGEDVGLPAGQMGNSEVGHTNIGAGRVVFQDLPRITNAVKDGSFFENEVLLRTYDGCRGRGGALHIMGLLSNGGVHSHTEHFWAAVELAKRRGLERVYIHAFLDGRDVSPTSGAGFVQEAVDKCAEIGVGSVATVMGRFYAMDRDKRWDRLQRAYNAIVCGEGKIASDPAAAVRESYEAGVTDEFVEPVICDESGMLSPGDAVLFMNFRPDRAREITRVLTDPDFTDVDRKKGFFPVDYVCMTQYDESLTNVAIAYPPEEIEGTFGEYVSELGLRQLRIAETEKYAHVTFFFNGGVERVSKGEDRVLIPSPKQFPTYDLIPEMSANAVADECAARIRSGEYDVVICNLANCDMVGHTGDMTAAIKAVETVDACVGRITAAVAEMGGVCLITADHGNADSMLAPDGSPNTAHTTNLVPLIITGADVTLQPGRLADIAPTMLELMGLQKPAQMNGMSLIVR